MLVLYLQDAAADDSGSRFIYISLPVEAGEKFVWTVDDRIFELTAPEAKGKGVAHEFEITDAQWAAAPLVPLAPTTTPSSASSSSSTAAAPGTSAGASRARGSSMLRQLSFERKRKKKQTDGEPPPASGPAADLPCITSAPSTTDVMTPAHPAAEGAPAAAAAAPAPASARAGSVLRKLSFDRGKPMRKDVDGRAGTGVEEGRVGGASEGGTDRNDASTPSAPAAPRTAAGFILRSLSFDRGRRKKDDAQDGAAAAAPGAHGGASGSGIGVEAALPPPAPPPAPPPRSGFLRQLSFDRGRRKKKEAPQEAGAAQDGACGGAP